MVPIVAALYEFVLKGRKRLGYRVQLNTFMTNVADLDDELVQAFQGIRDRTGGPLDRPSLTLLRIENDGFTDVAEDDYKHQSRKKDWGFRFVFPGREVVGVVITSLSDDSLDSNFSELRGSHTDEKEKVRGGTIEIPRVELKPGQHFKVLALLDGGEIDPRHKDEPSEPIMHGGLRFGSTRKTQSRTGTPRSVLALIGFLVVLMAAQLVIFLRTDTSTPLDCASGHLTVLGSTAFKPIVEEAADAYTGICPGASFSFAMAGSGEGLEKMEDLQSTPSAYVAFADGRKPEGAMPYLVGRPMSFFLFALAVDADAGVADLTAAQIRDIYAGRITDWKQVGGADLPIRIITRHPDSGTRAAFKDRVLHTEEARYTVANCPNGESAEWAGKPYICEVSDTEKLVSEVSKTKGSIGYGEVGAVTDTAGVTAVRIDDHAPTLEQAEAGLYPFWETEYAYTFADVDARSLNASFLRFLTNQVGADILRSHGLRPCPELANPARCQPV
ncbi:substrate-binding domain-containing protein [Actinoplanes sp. NPDC051851]|uniref:PstS family phosphate ABC transporter substrate-binding protein n=1 Tax=Actinoplanes sp. NPDC051851 TaxID=3154753 RepID=UPI003416EFBA